MKTPNPYDPLAAALAEHLRPMIREVVRQVVNELMTSDLPEWCDYAQSVKYIDNGRTTARALSTAKSSGKIPEWATNGALLHREWVKAYRETGDYGRAEQVAAGRLP